MTKVAVIFRTNAFDLSWPADAIPDSGDAWGKDCALYLAERFPKNGVTVLSPQPISGEGGWYLDIKLDADLFTLFVQWLPVGDPPRDFWAIQIMPRHKFLAKILRRRISDGHYDRVRTAINSILVADPRISEVRWMTKDEFSSL